MHARRQSVSPTDLLRKLETLGCHVTDAIDALDATGTNWWEIHNAEVLRRRNAHD